MIERPEQSSKDGWIIETKEHAIAISKFLQKYQADEREGHRRPAGVSHSGENYKVFQAISEGTAAILRINVLYEKGKPIQIHVEFDHQNTGNIIDYYLTGQALADYVKTKI